MAKLALLLRYVILPGILLYAVLFLVGVGREPTPSQIPTASKSTDLNESITQPPPHWAPICKIHDVDYWDDTIKRYVTRDKLPDCKWTPQLTYTEGLSLKGNLNVLKKEYSGKNLSCQLTVVLRKPYNDNAFLAGKVTHFSLQEGVRNVSAEFIKVECFVKKNLVYMNYHTFVQDKADVVKRMRAYDESTNGTSMKKHWNVILIGTDTLSRGAAVRYMPRTREFILKHLGAIDMLGYTKVGENSYANLLPFHTGRNRAEIEKPKETPLDYLPLMYKNYTAAGYTTFFGEDMPFGTVFNYQLSGFREPPTDYYYHPLAWAVYKNREKFKYKGCEKLGVTNRIILNYLKQFLMKYQHSPFFAQSYMSDLSHDNILLVRRLDQMYVELLMYLKQMGLFKNTFLFMFGDHGPRIGKFLKTKIGKLESRLPYMSVAAPVAFVQRYPDRMQNLRINSRRLTSHYDAYATFLDILHPNNSGDGLPKGRAFSLFSEIPEHRSCLSAGVPLLFCACYTEENTDVKSNHVQMGARFLVKEINDILRSSNGLCEWLVFEKVTTAIEYKGDGAKDNTRRTYKLTFVTIPGYGEFIGTIQVSKERKIHVTNLGHAFIRKGPISRVNKYGNQSICVKKRDHRLFCFCKTTPSSVSTTTSQTLTAIPTLTANKSPTFKLKQLLESYRNTNSNSHSSFTNQPTSNNLRTFAHRRSSRRVS